MKPFVLGAVLLGTLGPARAEPAPACTVTIDNAPDDARAEIEAWVRAEPRCDTELDIVVQPVEAGLHLTATDRAGRTRERTVPDARSAAALVVSWMAAPDDDDDDDDDRATEADPTPAPIAIAASPVIARPPPRAERLDGSASPSGSDRAIVIAVSGHGVRAQLDGIARAGWRLGLAAGLEREGAAQLRVVGAREWSRGRFSLRAQIGIGADFETHDDDRTMHVDRMDAGARDRLHPEAEIDAALLGGVRLGTSWRVLGGPLVDREGATAWLGLEHSL